MGGVCSDIKADFFLSFCVCVLCMVLLQYPLPHCYQLSLHSMPLSCSLLDRAAACPDLGGTGERLFFACDTLFPFLIKWFLQCCLLGTRCCSCLELPWLLGLGSCTALIQFIMQLHNCSQSPVDLDVKQRSSCTSPGRGGEISGQTLRTFELGFWNGMWHIKAKPDQ